MLSAKICALYPDLAGLSYLQQLQRFMVRQRQQASEKWDQWFENGSIGPEPERVSSTPLMRAVQAERNQVWLQLWAKESRRIGWGKKAALRENANFLHWMNDGLQQRINRIEDLLNRQNNKSR